MTLTRNQGCQPGRKNLRLRALFPIGRDNVLARQRGCSVYLVQDGDFIRLDMDIRGRSQANQCNNNKHDSQGQRERPKVWPSSIDKSPSMLGATAARTKYKIATTTQNIVTSQPACSADCYLTASSAVPSPEISISIECPRSGIGSAPCCRSSRSCRVARASPKLQACRRARQAHSADGPSRRRHSHCRSPAHSSTAAP